MARALLWGGAAVAVDAHFAMIKPPSWVDPDGSAYSNWDPDFGWRATGCTGEAPPTGEEPVIGCLSQWYSNGTTIPGNRTLPDAAVSYKKNSESSNPVVKSTWESMQKNPWMAPGTAPVWSPCGHDGGNPQGCPVGNPGRSGCQQGGYGHGPDARSLAGNSKPAEWTAGAVEETIYGITANHGGGYQYRLCPKPASGDYMDLTEECFQRTPLPFVGDTQWIQQGGDEANRTAIPAVRLDVGTFPKGSAWTRNPIPACGTLDGGGVLQQVCHDSQFPEPVPGASGFYGLTPNDVVQGTTYQRKLTHFSVVDKVQVPVDLPTGDYVISFRIDCEQTPQVWLYCGDARISQPDAVSV